jgi:diaminopimelate decarboxylase
MEKQRYERPVIKRLESNLPNKFGKAISLAPVTHIEGLPVGELLDKYGSPLFVLSEKQIRSTFQKAKNAFEIRYPKVQFAWSYKTNYLNAVCQVYHQEGSWAEVVSGFEYQKALANGVDGKKIIFNGPDKTEADLTMAIDNNSLIHIDHLDELYTLKDLTEKMKKKARVAIRVNMDTGVYPMWDRFGFNYENGQAWDALNKIMHSDNLELVGLHTHIGTFMMTAHAYGIAASKMMDLAIGLKNRYQHIVKYIDMGGGFASSNTLKGAYLPGVDTSPSFDDYAEAITSPLINAEFDKDQMPMLILETGRALIDDAGYLLGTVIANKRLSDGRKTTIVDVGVNILFTSFWYDHKISPAQPFNHYSEDTVLYGPLCMNIDVIRESVNLPPMNKGDHFVVHQVGAYNMTQWMQFITLRPKIVMIDPEGIVHVIREAEALEQLNDLEKTPKHLVG